MDCSLPGSSVYGILQARILEQAVTPFSRGSSRSGDRTQVSHTAGEFFHFRAIREAQDRVLLAKSQEASKLIILTPEVFCPLSYLTVVISFYDSSSNILKEKIQFNYQSLFGIENLSQATFLCLVGFIIGYSLFIHFDIKFESWDSQIQPGIQILITVYDNFCKKTSMQLFCMEISTETDRLIEILWPFQKRCFI